LAMVAEHVPECREPLDGCEQAALDELAGGAPEADLAQSMENAPAAAFEQNLDAEAAIAASLDQRAVFWRVREHIPEALARAGTCIPCDVSVPVSSVPAFIPAATAAVAKHCPGIRVIPFGHVGDGNIHFDLLEPEGTDGQDFVADLDAITAAVYDVVQQFAGSFSAEHGIGKLKVEDMRRYHDAVELDMLRAVKQAFDPQGLMNPGKVVPA